MKQGTHAVSAGQLSRQFELSELLPGLDEGDPCFRRLCEHLASQKGISEAHLVQDEAKHVLCLHYDPNLVPLDRLQRFVSDTGLAIAARYRHELVSIQGLTQGTDLQFIEQAIGQITGVLYVAVNYATEKLKIEYDSQQTNLDSVLERARSLGYRVEKLLPSAGVSSFRAQPPSKLEANWFRRNPELTQSLLCGVLGSVAYACPRFTALPEAVSIVFYALAYLAGGFDLARHTVPVLLRGKFDVELLMLVAAAGAALLGNWTEGTLLLFLFSLGHALEHYAMDRARHAIESLGNITPKVVRVRREGQEIEIAVDELRIGDIALVRPGDRVAVDGKITGGSSSVDQSPITGESVPVEKSGGDSVFAGSINGDGALEVEVTKLAQDTTMARVIRMVEEAQTQKSPTQTFTDQFERFLVPTVLFTVVLAAVLPPWLGLLPWKIAILRSLSTLVAASPCALALATPAAVLAGIAQAARNGVLIKGGAHLENLGLVSAIALDKTGTVTRGRPEVTDVLPASGVTQERLLSVAASIEIHSSHPLAQAVIRRAQAESLELAKPEQVQSLQGLGIRGELEGQVVRLGNARMFREAQVALPAEVEKGLERCGESGKPVMIVGYGDKVLGLIALADEIRPELADCLKQLRNAGIEDLIMLTGDNEKVARSVAQVTGLTDVRANLLPESKVAAIKELLEKHGNVAMVGDGVNDAPALASSTVGIAMGAGGTDVALETADVALMADDLSKLPFAVSLSRMSRRIIKQNLFLSLGVIAMLVPSTLLGYTSMGLAVACHEGSTLAVVLNALRLLRFKPVSRVGAEPRK